MITLIAYTSTFGVLGSYALANRRGDPRIFHWGNAIFFLPLTAVNLLVGAHWAAIISFTFGVIALAALRNEDGELA